MDSYQKLIHLSRYARWIPEKGRRETWDETVQRYIDYFVNKFGVLYPADALFQAIRNLKVVPSMRAVMTAGEALDRDNIAAFNCSYVAIDHPRAFDEIMYILMCFHPSTMVRCLGGDKAICHLNTEDQVLSYNETSKKFEWKQVKSVFKTPSEREKKYKITLENGKEIKCTWNHKWLTENRGWVMAQDLTLNDELVTPKYSIYKLTNTWNNKMYVGYTSKSPLQRFKEHVRSAKSTKKDNHLFRAIRKNGESCWKIDTLDMAYSLEEAHNKERQYIGLLNTKVFGYNGTDGGEGTNGSARTPEQRQRMKRSAYERTEQHRQNQRETLLKLSLPKILLTRKTEKYKEQIKQRPRDSYGRFA